jgi:hypothetical protein
MTASTATLAGVSDLGSTLANSGIRATRARFSQ